MQELQIFKYEDKEVGTVFIDGSPWWVAKDVCGILEIQNTSQALESLDEEERLTYVENRSGQNREVNIISESGLYSLVIQSRKPEAKKFKKWITSEVLPTLRKTGKYEIQTAVFDSNDVSEKIDSIESMMGKLLRGRNRAPLAEVMSSFVVIDHNEEWESVVVEYSNRLFHINRENYFSVFTKYRKDDNSWDTSWRKVESRLGSLKKALLYILDNY